MNFEKIKAFAKDNGYTTAKRLDDWNGYEVYEPVMNGDGISFIGPPLVILVKNEHIRMSTVEEAFERLSSIDDEE